MYADEASQWNALHAGWDTYRINHSEAYALQAGVSTNQAESYFSRLRRIVAGQHHHVTRPMVGFLARFAFSAVIP
jgi:hypothetical protein